MITETQVLINNLRETAKRLKRDTTLYSVADLIFEAADKIEALVGGIELTHLDPDMYERIFISIGDACGPKYAPTVRQALFNQIIEVKEAEANVEV